MARTVMTVALGAAVALAVGTAAAPASAKIRCDGRYQIVHGQGPISTPYCEDNYLAYVARGYGMHVSGRAVRRNPHVKEQACRVAGYDDRVRDICADWLPDGGGRYVR